jgi:hypothetical protein
MGFVHVELKLMTSHRSQTDGHVRIRSGIRRLSTSTVRVQKDEIVKFRRWRIRRLCCCMRVVTSLVVVHVSLKSSYHLVICIST